jgi:ATP-dependent Clp protease protease subunit
MSKNPRPIVKNNEIKNCISCGSDKNVRHQGPRCVNCYRKEINPAILDRIKAYRKAKGATTTDRFHKGKTEAKLRKIVWNLSKEEFAELNSKPCFYCGGPLPTNGVGLDRISNEKTIGYVKENVVPCCGICNSIRGDKLTVSETIAAVHSVKEHRMAVIQKFHEENVHVDSRTVCIFGEIDKDLSLQVCKAFDILENINKYAEITVKVMSEGGDWFEGLAIYDRIKSSPCPVRMIGMGMVASTATAIFQAGGMREITEHCVFVLHDGVEGFEGEAKSFEAWGETSKKSRHVLYEIYSKASGKPASFFQTLCLKDSILWSKDIINFGLADKILGDK